jgi:undecaprenyl-diphosphatase
MRKLTRQYILKAALAALILVALHQTIIAADKKGGPEAGLGTGQAIILGLVEGITEYLPVSSTGHLFLAQRIMGIGDSGAAGEAAGAYAICIQFGAILAVFFLYFSRIKSMFLGMLGRDENGRRIMSNLIFAFLPAALIGITFEKIIKDRLFGIVPITAAWLVGGIALLIMARSKSDAKQGRELAELSWRHAVIIGVAQCFAMWPGTSRSLITIIGGVAVGLNLSAAVEFSFLLGLVTLSAATVYEGLKQGGQIIALFGWLNPIIGVVVAFISAVAAVKLMVSFLNRNAMAWFGAYRVILALAVIIALLAKWL